LSPSIACSANIVTMWCLQPRAFRWFYLPPHFFVPVCPATSGAVFSAPSLPLFSAAVFRPGLPPRGSPLKRVVPKEVLNPDVFSPRFLLRIILLQALVPAPQVGYNMRKTKFRPFGTPVDN